MNQFKEITNEELNEVNGGFLPIPVALVVAYVCAHPIATTVAVVSAVGTVNAIVNFGIGVVDGFTGKK